MIVLNLLESEWSDAIQWIYHQLKKGKRKKNTTTTTHRFLPPDMTGDNSSHVLTFWQEASVQGGEGILRMFFCRRDGESHVQIIKDLHLLPISHATVSFVRVVHLARRCLGGRLFSLPFLEAIAMKIAYVELSNVFKLTNENVMWMMTHRDTMNNNKLMIGSRFLLDDFVQDYPNMHTYTLVNYFSKFVRDITFDATTVSDDQDERDNVSHLECRHTKLLPQIVNQDFITPDRMSEEGRLACKVCNRGASPLMNTDNVIFHHACKILDVSCYASRSFIMHYDATGGLDQDVSEQNLTVTRDNVLNFFFYSTPTKDEGAAGKDINVCQEEAIRTLMDFMGNQWAKFESDRPANHHIRAGELRKHLSRVDQPLKKINNDKGDIRIQNHTNALRLLWGRGFVQQYLKDCTTLYNIDIVETRNDPSSSHVTRCVDYTRCPMPSQLTITIDMLQKLNNYFKANQRFKKDSRKKNMLTDQSRLSPQCL